MEHEREEMYRAINKHGLNSQEALQASQVLDKEVYKYTKNTFMARAKEHKRKAKHDFLTSDADVHAIQNSERIRKIKRK